MSVAKEVTDDWIGYWMYLSQRTVDSWYGVTRKAKGKQYGPQEWFSDAVDFWTDAAVASWAVWRGVDRTPPCMIFVLDSNDDFGPPQSTKSPQAKQPTQSTPVYAQRLPHKEPSVVWLGPVGDPPGTGSPVTENNLRADLVESDSELTVTVKDLIAPLAPATYRAIIHVEEVPLAEVFIVVRQARYPSAPTVATASSPGKPHQPGGPGS